ncbi:nuclear transport factor 2 family protein [Solirubrobacter phytolaccae]|uniref:Nuclear transport factor 2 family protein n=1 Tax=Solirubrobacter phytolaccae TaxID=1404360 RepID=A0A9X3N9P9_9ACTN|nr:nuclear transport factor 2 family protein [Solirubrobacter phytolaccae]MDA0182575.1 nuclear transport factor 2 family protein [Solirubrobacter phytolaccae]
MLPPEHAVPVESPLIERFYAAHDWSVTATMLAPDFVWIDQDGKARKAKHLRSQSQWFEAAYDNAHATLDAVVADLGEPSVLYVRGVTHARARNRFQEPARIDVAVWTRFVITSDGTRIRQIGPSSVIDGA